MTRHTKIFKTAVLFLTLALLLLFAADATDTLLRERRERALFPLARHTSLEFDVPLSLVLAVLRVESDFDITAHSRAGAVGPMQLMPETFYYLRDQKQNEALADTALYDAATNIRYGTYYLSYLFSRFGEETAVLAAYNAGEGRVGEWLQNEELTKNNRLIDIPFPETRAYVQRVQSARLSYLQKYQLKE